MSSPNRLPEVLPLPQRDSLSATFEQVNSRTEMDLGAPRQRRMRSTAPRHFSVSLLLTAMQFQQFEYWFQNSIKGGSLVFDMQLLDDDNTLVWYTVNVIGEYTYQNVGTASDQWMVRMTVRSKLPSFTTRDSGTELIGRIDVGTELQGNLYVPFTMRGAVSVGTELQGLIRTTAMRGRIDAGADLSGQLSIPTPNLLGRIDVGTTLSASLSIVSPLDTYTASLAYAFARQRLIGTYAGPLYRVRRDSDNTEQDVTADAGGSETTSLTGFVGSANGYVTKWYDQSGNGYVLAQGTSGKQPLIVDNGTPLPNIEPDYVDDGLLSTGALAAMTAPTTYGVGQVHPFQNVASSAVVYSNGVTKQRGHKYSTNPFVDVGGGTATYASNGFLDTSVAWSTDYTLGTVVTQNVIREALASKTLTVGTSTVNSTTVDSSVMSVFMNPAGTGNYSASKMRAIVGYNTLHTSTLQDAIATALQKYPTTDMGPLAQLQVGMIVAVGVKQLLTAYTGPLLRVRRSSDNAELDIGFVSGGALDTTALAAFVPSGNAFVTKWYDQSGHGRDIVQATTTKQPAIVTASVYLGSVQGDGVDDQMSFTAPACRAVTYASRMQLRTTTVAGQTYAGFFGSATQQSSGNNAFSVILNVGTSQAIGQLLSGTTLYDNQTFNISTVEHVYVFAATNALGTGGKFIRGYSDGSSINSGGFAGPGANGNQFPGQQIDLFRGVAAGNGSAPANMKSFVMWAAAIDGRTPDITAAL